MDARVVEHAKWLVNYCTSVKRGDNVLIRLGGAQASGDEDGHEVTDVRLTFEKGVIVDFSASKNEDFLKHILETDEGAKRLGELGVGTNQGINRFTRNILFDEKMAETIHIAIGFAYGECGGINKSAVHWDMIKTMKPGEIVMDGKPVQKDGKFIWE